MGPRLGRVEYGAVVAAIFPLYRASMGPRLGRVEYASFFSPCASLTVASMGPRLGRVEYEVTLICVQDGIERFNGATLRTRGIPVSRLENHTMPICFNGATLRTRGIP